MLDQIAGDYGVSRTVMALAWLLKHPSRIIPIVGSNHPERIRESIKADEIELSREELVPAIRRSTGRADA